MLETCREDSPPRLLLLLNQLGLVSSPTRRISLCSIIPAARSNFALRVGICSEFWKLPKTVKVTPNSTPNRKQGLGVDKVWCVLKKIGKGEKARGSKHVIKKLDLGVGLGIRTRVGHATQRHRSARPDATDQRVAARALPAPGARTRPTAPAAAASIPPASGPGHRLPGHRDFTAPDASSTQPDQAARSRRSTLHVASASRYVECVRLARACARRGAGTQPWGLRETACSPAQLRRGGAAGRIT